MVTTKEIRKQVLKEHRQELVKKTTKLKEFVEELGVSQPEAIAMFELIKGFWLKD